MNSPETNFKQTTEMVEKARMMYRVLKNIFEFYGCQHCSLCCKAFTPVVQKREIENLATYLRIKPKKFKRKYCIKLGLPFNKYELKAPCPFINGSSCNVYSFRPKPCRTFPFELDPGDGLVRLVGVEVCPTATLIYYDFLDYHDKIKHLLPISKEEEKEIEEIVANLEKMFVDKRKQIGVPESTGGIYAMISIVQWYFFALYRIKKVDNIEERVKEYYEKNKIK